MRACRTDERHAEVAEALRRCGYAYISLHRQGGGCEDFLVAVRSEWVEPHEAFGNLRVERKGWLMLEVKTKRGNQALRFTEHQREWYEKTNGWPRIVVTGAEDAIKQIRAYETGVIPSAPCPR